MKLRPQNTFTHHQLDYVIHHKASKDLKLPNRDALKAEVVIHSYKIKDRVIKKEKIDFTDLAIIVIDELTLYKSKKESNLRTNLKEYSDSEREWIKRLFIKAYNNPKSITKNDIDLLEKVSSKLFRTLAGNLGDLLKRDDPPIELKGYTFEIDYPEFGIK